MKYVFWSLQKSTGIFCTRAKNLNLFSKNAPWLFFVISLLWAAFSVFDRNKLSVL